MAQVEKRNAGSPKGGGGLLADTASLERFHKHMQRVTVSNEGRLAKLLHKAKSFDFLPMATLIPQAKQGNVEVQHFSVSEDQSKVTVLKATFNDPMYFVPPGVYARLMVDDEIMMTDTAFEKATAFEFLQRAQGSVLITGLGLGVILPPLCSNKRVKKILVIEKSQDVIDLVWPTFESAYSKLHVKCADAFDWHPGKERFDTIWFDIWPSINDDNLPAITKLKRRYGQWLNRDNPSRWQGAWVERRLRRMRRQSNDEMEMINSIRRGTLGGDVV